MNQLKKKYLFLLIIVIIGVIAGVIFSNILSTNDEKLVYNKLTNYFLNLKNDVPLNYLSNLIENIKNNLLYIIIIWLLGLSIIGLFLNNFILFFKSFIIGFSIGSIINIYLYKGLILSFLYLFPSEILNLFLYYILVYYANNFSLQLFKVLFLRKEYKFNNLVKQYVKIFLVFSSVILVSSLYETFITPLSIKLFSFLID